MTLAIVGEQPETGACAEQRHTYTMSPNSMYVAVCSVKTQVSGCWSTICCTQKLVGALTENYREFLLIMPFATDPSYMFCSWWRGPSAKMLSFGKESTMLASFSFNLLYCPGIQTFICGIVMKWQGCDRENARYFDPMRSVRANKRANRPISNSKGSNLRTSTAKLGASSRLFM